MWDFPYCQTRLNYSAGLSFSWCYSMYNSFSIECPWYWKDRMQLVAVTKPCPCQHRKPRLDLVCRQTLRSLHWGQNTLDNLGSLVVSACCAHSNKLLIIHCKSTKTNQLEAPCNKIIILNRLVSYRGKGGH